MGFVESLGPCWSRIDFPDNQISPKSRLVVGGGHMIATGQLAECN
jgi:hypothetical protein